MKKEIKKKKILVWADSPSVPTGWGHVVKFVLSKMNKKKYEFVILGINYYGDPHKTPYRIYPPGTKTPGDVYGMTRLADIIHIEKPDILWLINDIWVIKDMLEAIKQTYTDKTPPIVVYFPVDAEDHSPSWYKNLDMVAKAVVYNEFGLSVAKKASPKTEFSIIGHGVDSRIFHPVFENRVEARKFLFGNVPALWDCFTFLNANRNQGRKRLDITMRAFKLFAEDKPDVRLYLHCGIIDAGIDVLRLAENLAIDNKLIVSSKATGVQKVSDERLNLIYNACDVGINSCYTPDTRVMTENGYKPIIDMQIGDMVSSHTGNFSKVTHKFIYSDKKKLIEITPFGAFKLKLTPNHKLFADARQYTHLMRQYKTEIRNNPQLNFVRADELQEGSVLTVPVIKREDYTIGEERAFLYGAFLAEGCFGRKDSVKFCLNSQESDDYLRNKIISYMLSIYGLEAHISNNTRNRQIITFYSTKVAKEFEDLFGRGAHNKRIPKEILYIKRNEKIQLLKGYFMGDGHLSNKSRSLSFTTVSEDLAWSVWISLISLGKLAPSIRQAARGEWNIKVFGDSADELARLFDLKLKKLNRQQRDKMWADENFAYYPIQAIQEIEYDGEVYDLEVEGEHSYLAHVAGHNSLGEGLAN